MACLCSITLGYSSAFACKKDIILNTKQPLSEQMTEKNATYRIKNDFDLSGKTLVLPKGSILAFEGGSFRNGVIVGQQTLLSDKVRCYTDIKGTFKNKELRTEWFTTEPTGLVKVLTQIIATNVNDIIISNGTWLVSQTVDLKSNLTIRGEGNTIIQVDRERVSGPYSLFRVSGTVLTFEKAYKYSDITIKDLSFDENGSNELGRTSILYACNVKNIIVHDCKFIDHASSRYAEYVTAAITLYNCRDCLIERCKTDFVRLVSCGFCIDCCAAHNTGRNSPGTWLECCDGYGIVYEWNEIHENLFPGNSTISQNSRKGIIRNNTIIVNGKEVDSMINIGHSSNNTYVNSGEGCLIEHNTIKTNTSKGIIIWGTGLTKDVVIRDNYIYSKSKNAIFVSDAIPNVNIVGNEIVGNDEGQVLVLIGALESRIESNRISTKSAGVKYIPIRVRRNDKSGSTIIDGNTIDNGGKSPVDKKKETLIDLAVEICHFINNTVNDGVHFLNVCPADVVMAGNVFNEVQNTLWHSNNTDNIPLKSFVARDNTINVNTSVADPYLTLFSINGEQRDGVDERKLVNIYNNKTNIGEDRNKVSVNISRFTRNGKFKELRNGR